MQVENNFYRNQDPQHHVITATTRKILHTRLNATAITDIHDIPKSVCNRTQAEKSISRHPICITDSNYDYKLK